mgnify:FL=1
MERDLLRKLGANCNSAISLYASDGILKGEIFGLEEFITFSGADVNQIFEDIKRNGGLRLLHEHN